MVTIAQRNCTYAKQLDNTGGLENYKSIIAVAGENKSPAMLFYNTEKWQLVPGKSLPSAHFCLDGTVPSDAPNDYRFTCAETPSASDGVCCQATNSPDEG